MKYYSKILLILALLSYSCIENQSIIYPDKIIQNKMADQFDLAKWELYLLYLSCVPEEKSRELLTHDFHFFDLDTLTQESDIIHFVSPFFEKVSYETDCQYFTGIGFNENKEINLLFIGENVALKYSKKSREEENNIIRNQILPYKSELNMWLLKYMKKRELI